jgi:hypothetical protein
MANDNLTGQFISDTYKRLIVLSEDGYITDGTGSIINELPVTASFAASASYVIGGITPEKRHDFDDPYSYCGTAPAGSLDSDYVWNITRIFISSSGNITTTSASMVDWDNRYIHIYY